ncbi:MAG: TolC family protein [Deinococcus sp.]|uniref:TolC family protein n=1 Tax=Deinococcus sp. TaxID=47478 RepID=UPI0026DBAB20|nr:TolC family protein [Deinococcus sp.]MDO4245440.1 TolC family protein [Deinococcus sp.]
MRHRFLLFSLPLLLGLAPAQSSPPAPLPVPAQAQPAPALTLPALLQSLRTSPGWRGADLTYRAAELGLASARARAGLTVQAGASAALSKFPWDTGDWTLSPAVNASFALPVLPWSPQREAVQSAERTLRAAAIELRSSRAGLTVQAAQAYAGARSAAAAAGLAAAQLALAESLLKVAQQQRGDNLIPQTALLERQASVEQARAGVAQAGRGLTLAAAQLSRLTGQSVTLSGNLADYAPVSTLVPAGLLQEPLDALIARALTQRPEIARAQAGLADAQAALTRAERDQRLPDITASVQAGQLGSTGGGGRTVGGSFGLKSGTVSGQVSFPLKEPTTRGVTAPGPDGKPVTTETALPSGVALNLSGTFTLLGSGRSQATAQAQAATEQAALAVQSARQGVELEVRSRFADLENARDSLTAAQTTLTRAQQTVQDARARLDAGLGTSLEVAQAELALTQARNSLDSLEAQVALAALGLAQATGDLDPLLLTQPLLTPLGERP